MENIPTFKEIQDLLDETRKIMPNDIQCEMLRQESKLLIEMEKTDFSQEQKALFYLTRMIEQMDLIQNKMDMDRLTENQKGKLEEIGSKFLNMAKSLLTATLPDNETIH